MPFRHAFRRYSASNDVHMVSIPLNESLEQWHEQEMDFTNYSQFSNTPANFKLLESTSYLQPNTYSLRVLQENASSSPSRAYPTNDFIYSQLISMDSDVPPLHASRTSSIATTSLASSEPENLPTNLPQSPRPEKMCPLIAGEIDSCQPSRCGPDAPCMNFANLPPIEECTSVPCISPPTNESGQVFPNPQPDHVLNRHQSPSSSSTRQSASPEKGTSSSTPQPKRRPGNRHYQQQLNEGDRVQLRLEARQRAKAAHSLVEKKYRENINTKLTLLHTTLQNAHYGCKRLEDVDSDFDFDAEIDFNSSPTKANPKFRKSDVLSDAMNYVNQTEVEMRHMENEIQRLNERVRTLERLVRCDDFSLSKGIVGLQVQPV